MSPACLRNSRYESYDADPFSRVLDQHDSFHVLQLGGEKKRLHYLLYAHVEGSGKRNLRDKRFTEQKHFSAHKVPGHGPQENDQQQGGQDSYNKRYSLKHVRRDIYEVAEDSGGAVAEKEKHPLYQLVEDENSHPERNNNQDAGKETPLEKRRLERFWLWYFNPPVPGQSFSLETYWV